MNVTGTARVPQYEVERSIRAVKAAAEQKQNEQNAEQVRNAERAEAAQIIQSPASRDTETSAKQNGRRGPQVDAYVPRSPRAPIEDEEADRPAVQTPSVGRADSAAIPDAKERSADAVRTVTDTVRGTAGAVRGAAEAVRSTENLRETADAQSVQKSKETEVPQAARQAQSAEAAQKEEEPRDAKTLLNEGRPRDSKVLRAEGRPWNVKQSESPREAEEARKKAEEKGILAGSEAYKLPGQEDNIEAVYPIPGQNEDADYIIPGQEEESYAAYLLPGQKEDTDYTIPGQGEKDADAAYPLPGQKEDGENTQVDRAEQEKQEKTAVNTDKINKEILSLKTKLDQVQRMVRMERNPEKAENLEKQAIQIRRELLWKNSPAYRRQETMPGVA